MGRGGALLQAEEIAPEKARGESGGGGGQELKNRATPLLGLRRQSGGQPSS